MIEARAWNRGSAFRLIQESLESKGLNSQSTVYKLKLEADSAAPISGPQKERAPVRVL
jgi:hypothetical protein